MLQIIFKFEMVAMNVTNITLTGSNWLTDNSYHGECSCTGHLVRIRDTRRWMVGQPRVASACSLALKDSYPRSQGTKVFRHLSPCSVNQSIYYQFLNQVEQYNQHQQSLSNRRAIRVKAPTESKPE